MKTIALFFVTIFVTTFYFNDQVEIIKGFYKGCGGIVTGYLSTISLEEYEIKILNCPKSFDGNDRITVFQSERNLKKIEEKK